ncbi:MAG: hypothetical protein KIB07_02205, partial [Finegoldia magna]
QILVKKVYFLKKQKISAHNLSGGADTQNFSHTQKCSIKISTPMGRIGQKNQRQIFLNVSGTKSNFLGSPYL